MDVSVFVKLALSIGAIFLVPPKRRSTMVKTLTTKRGYYIIYFIPRVTCDIRPIDGDAGIDS